MVAIPLSVYTEIDYGSIKSAETIMFCARGRPANHNIKYNDVNGDVAIVPFIGREYKHAQRRMALSEHRQFGVRLLGEFT